MKIIVLGTGCTKCQQTYDLIKRVAAEVGAEIELTKVEDIMEIIKYNVLSTPSVLVDGELKIRGRMPTESEVKEILKKA